MFDLLKSAKNIKKLFFLYLVLLSKIRNKIKYNLNLSKKKLYIFKLFNFYVKKYICKISFK